VLERRQCTLACPEWVLWYRLRVCEDGWALSVACDSALCVAVHEHEMRFEDQISQHYIISLRQARELDRI